MKKSYKVYGMMCTACVLHVEHAVLALPFVTSASVSLLTSGMTVEFDGDEEAILAAVKKAGYRAVPIAENEIATVDTAEKTRLLPVVLSLILSALLAYFEMGRGLLPYPAFLLPSAHPILYLAVLFSLTAPIIILNRRIFFGGIRSLLGGAPNMDTLIALGSGAAFTYGTGIFLAFLFANPAPALAAHAPFASAGMILALITLGKALEGRAKDKTADAIRALASLTPDTVTVLDGREERTISARDLTLEHILILKAGDRIPCDGRIEEGHLSIDESALTGESLPVEKAQGAEVLAGCTVSDGYARIRPTEIGEETSLSRTIRLVSEAAATKAPIAKVADKISRVFVPCVMTVSLITLLLHWLIAKDFSTALHHAISVLVISCPCALGLATPTAIMCAVGRGASLGILIKNAGALEALGRTRQIVFDKTGTLTKGRMQVLAHVAADGEEEALFSAAHSIEARSEHPLAAAIFDYTKGAKEIPIDKFSLLHGKGLFAKSEKTTYAAGNLALMEECEIETDEIEDFVKEHESRGATVIYVAKADGLIGAFAIADTVREDAKETVRTLKELGITVSMLTGDALAPAKATADALGIEAYRASLTPEEKSNAITQIEGESGSACMVGDGINDCLPLTAATVGVAIGSGSDIAIESADIVIRGEHSADVLHLVKLSRLTLRKIRQNLFWALLYNCICIPIAAGALAPLGITLSPALASAAMALSSLTVVSNALTIKRAKI
jgi:Cu2+-exporting ATPase